MVSHTKQGMTRDLRLPGSGVIGFFYSLALHYSPGLFSALKQRAYITPRENIISNSQVGDERARELVWNSGLCRLMRAPLPLFREKKACFSIQCFYSRRAATSFTELFCGDLSIFFCLTARASERWNEDIDSETDSI